jgi:hypothetical protein
MLRRLGLLLSALAMFAIAGGHWAVFQSVAWAGMVSDYSRTDGFTTAVQKTFSGEYPCAMCKRIAMAEKQQEQAPVSNVKAETKLLLGLISSSSLVVPPASSRGTYPPVLDSLLVSRSDRPPTPVPIGA